MIALDLLPRRCPVCRKDTPTPAGMKEQMAEDMKKWQVQKEAAQSEATQSEATT